MSRKLDRSVTIVVPNVVTNLLTCPAGHKYEIVDIAAQGDLINVYTWRFLTLGAPVNFQLGDVVVPPTVRAAHNSYQGMILFAGETLRCNGVTAGVTNLAVAVMYVDVSPV